jgi:hypothetical protein
MLNLIKRAGKTKAIQSDLLTVIKNLEDRLEENQNEIKKLRSEMDALLKKQFRTINKITTSLPFMETIKYGLSTIDFLESENALEIEVFQKKTQLLKHCISKVSSPGLVLEFGVFNGETINEIAKLFGPSVAVHGFDSFEGLPASEGFHLSKGHFTLGGVLPAVVENVKLHKGWFDKTLPDFTKNNPGPVAFIHMDCDLYESTKCVFDLLKPQIGPGCIIVFDEYYNFKNWQKHEVKAFKEFLAETGHKYEYIGRSIARQAAVRIL